MNKKKKPKFSRHPKMKRVGGGWRKPRGRFSKKRLEKKGKGELVRVGYGAAKDERFLHPCGKMEVMVENLKDLEKIDPEKECARIRSKVGKRKREIIEKKAKEMKIKVL